MDDASFTWSGWPDGDMSSAAASNSRALVYRFLSRSLAAAPDAELVEGLRALGRTGEVGIARIDQGRALIRRYLDGVSKGGGRFAIDELSREYRRLFPGSAECDGEQLSPYESVNFAVDEDDAEDLCLDVSSTLEEAGVLFSPDWTGRADHVAVELELMGVYARRAAAAIERGDEHTSSLCLRQQRMFFSSHVGNWVPGLAERMGRLATTGFYRGLALVIQGFLEVEAQALECEEQHAPTGISA